MVGDAIQALYALGRPAAERLASALQRSVSPRHRHVILYTKVRRKAPGFSRNCIYAASPLLILIRSPLISNLAVTHSHTRS